MDAAVACCMRGHVWAGWRLLDIVVVKHLIFPIAMYKVFKIVSILCTVAVFIGLAAPLKDARNYKPRHTVQQGIVTSNLTDCAPQFCSSTEEAGYSEIGPPARICASRFPTRSTVTPAITRLARKAHSRPGNKRLRISRRPSHGFAIEKECARYSWWASLPEGISRCITLRIAATSMAPWRLAQLPQFEVDFRNFR